MQDLPANSASASASPSTHAPYPDTVGLAVVIVTFNAADVILDNLESLFAQSGDLALEIVVVDNGSTDGTVAALRDWASGRVPFQSPTDLPFDLSPTSKPVVLADDGQATQPPAQPRSPRLTLLDTGLNCGFAGGVNRGLALLAEMDWSGRIWILNPDAVAAPGSALAFATFEPGPFALMGGRVVYTNPSDVIQIDGGTVNRRTGITGNINQGARHSVTPPPDLAEVDFIMGASMVASPDFLQQAGYMPEDYFLYYEEVAWAWARGNLPYAYCPGGVVYHRAGTAIGSPTPDRIASPFSLYFKHRSRRRFIRTHLPGAMPTAWAYTIAKAAQYVLQGHRAEARAMLAGFRDAPPPAEIRDMLSDDAKAYAFVPM